MTSRVVITGLGLVTPLGVGVKTVWPALLAGQSGLVSTTTIEENQDQWASVPSKVVGRVPRGLLADGKWDVNDHFDASDARRVAPFAQYAMAACDEALRDANWFPESDEAKEHTGVCVGSGIGSLEDSYANSVAFHEKGYRRVQPLFIPRLLSNMATGAISIKHQFRGPTHSVATACATGVHSIGDAARFIKDGYADVMIAGAAEASLHPLALSGFARAKSVITGFNDAPEKASRPFDSARNGFVLAEGSGIVVLESLAHAQRRRAHIYGEIVGYGLSGDGHHITAPSPNGNGALRAMKGALRDIHGGESVPPSELGYINAHATSTLLGDRAENEAIRSLFGENPELSVSSTKGSIGHLLGAAGAVESIFTILAMYHGQMPPTLNCEHPGEAEGDNKADFLFDYVPQSRAKDVKYAMCNSFGFGGTNASLCFKKYEKT
ncbi:hypothetical protein BABINDRAFT_162719 [Babjeviella inositovora NRRL Y-12698]|uniref:3-oxoacyl-[acyl-carrier-protein] synthase n=1 Tax=Babjeviella inositovora NRRL Y-12698 TaxID=984486 RepID=A0A1E3QM27_9ASCO|nr:uncharacterized protein BABINDRAFT_162719 [Babjeviella inositovora NRRL Y-12698]ODQ78514.1 hypothetical protein BABINDRAFT_162719 [Babjeviella inositovora NRRL Y-12698]